jgi:hypothetical protein
LKVLHSLNWYLCEQSVPEQPNTNTQSHITISAVQAIPIPSLTMPFFPTRPQFNAVSFLKHGLALKQFIAGHKI